MSVSERWEVFLPRTESLTPHAAGGAYLFIHGGLAVIRLSPRQCPEHMLKDDR